MRVLRHPLYPHPLPPPSTPKTLKVGLPERLGETSILKSSYKCLSLITLDFVIRANKKYYPQTLLEECKYKIKKNKMENLINDDLDPSSSDESFNESDNGSDNDESNFNLLKVKTFNNNNNNNNNNHNNNNHHNNNNNKSLIMYVNHALLGFYLCQLCFLQH